LIFKPSHCFSSYFYRRHARQFGTRQSASASGGLMTLLAAGMSNNFRVTFADATPVTATFAGIVTKFEPGAPLNDYQRADCTIKVSGAIT